MTQKNILSFSFLILALLAGTYFISAYKGRSVSSTVTCQSSNVNCPWYAVYLTNNQVYFGHIAESADSRLRRKIKDDTMVLEDVHFAETYQEPAQVVKGKTFAIEQPAKQTFRVTQKGNDKMLSSDHKLFINRASVLYWEKLSPTAEVVKLLEASK